MHCLTPHNYRALSGIVIGLSGWVLSELSGYRGVSCIIGIVIGLSGRGSAEAHLRCCARVSEKREIIDDVWLPLEEGRSSVREALPCHSHARLCAAAKHLFLCKLPIYTQRKGGRLPAICGRLKVPLVASRHIFGYPPDC